MQETAGVGKALDNVGGGVPTAEPGPLRGAQHAARVTQRRARTCKLPWVREEKNRKRNSLSIGPWQRAEKKGRETTNHKATHFCTHFPYRNPIVWRREDIIKKDFLPAKSRILAQLVRPWMAAFINGVRPEGKNTRRKDVRLRETCEFHMEKKRVL